MSSKCQLVVENEWWDYYPVFFDPYILNIIYSEVSQTCKIHKINIYGKIYDSKRMSCYFTFLERESPNSRNYNYNNLPAFEWNLSPTISTIKEIIEKYMKTYYDYCLVHIYRDGNDNIGWHNDEEALNTDVVSVSFGNTRKFRFRKIGKTSGWETEIFLNGGDLLHMKNGCQRQYKHCVPVEKSIKGMRINLTFRKLE